MEQEQEQEREQEQELERELELELEREQELEHLMNFCPLCSVLSVSKGKCYKCKTVFSNNVGGSLFHERKRKKKITSESYFAI